VAAPRISILSFASASLREQERGLLGWFCLLVDDLLVLDGIGLRRTRDGRQTLAFPERRDSAGRRHPVVRPLDDARRREIEERVFATLPEDAP